jgi:hypothetical protein
MNQTYPQPVAAVKCFSAHRLNELIVTAALVMWRQALAFLTLYDELSTARTLEGFAAVRVRLQKEWIFNAGFVSRFTILFSFF